MPESTVRRPKLLLWPVFGAFIAVSGAALYQWLQIDRAGYSLDSVPPLTMVVDVMRLHVFAGYGAAVGAVLGIVEAIVIAARHRLGARRREDDAYEDHDVDSRIREMRARRADSYLAGRSTEGAPPVENVITAQGGAHVYRVLAWRRLAEAELKQVVWEALEDGRIQRPAGSGTVTLVTDIGK